MPLWSNNFDYDCWYRCKCWQCWKNTTIKMPERIHVDMHPRSNYVFVIIFPISRSRRNLHSFSEELVLLSSVGIHNLVWSSFTFLASKVGELENIKSPNSWKTKHQMPEFFSPALVFHGINLIYFTYQVSCVLLIISISSK